MIGLPGGPWISDVSDDLGHIGGRTRPRSFADELTVAIPIREADQRLIGCKSATYPPLAKTDWGLKRQCV
jgi:hypothetical protein